MLVRHFDIIRLACKHVLDPPEFEMMDYSLSNVFAAMDERTKSLEGWSVSGIAGVASYPTFLSHLQTNTFRRERPAGKLCVRHGAPVLDYGRSVTF
jgi:phenylalanine-4-hydroxylase